MQNIKMASSLSDDDFQILQTQLIELKTQNYTLDEQNAKRLTKINYLQQKIETLENENQKAQKLIAKSRKIKDVEILLLENQNLQIKLQSQEDEFTLQNTTLMEEVSRLIARNETLEKELQSFTSERSIERQIPDGSANTDQNQENEVRRLLAENSVLKKNISDLQQNCKKEISRLRKSLHDLMRVHEPLNESADDDIQKSAIEQDGKGDYGFVEVGEKEVSYRKLSTNSLPTMELLQEFDVGSADATELSEAKLLLDTEREEKRILQDELAQKQQTTKLQLQKLEEEVGRLSEKLKRKQDSLVQLQQEKEQMYEQNKQSMMELQQTKDLEIHQLQELSQRLQTQLSNAFQNLQDIREHSSRTIEELELCVSGLKGQLDNQAADVLKNLEADRIVLQSQLSDLRVTTDSLRKENATLKQQLEIANAESAMLTSQLSALEEKHSQLTENLENLQKTADKRKCLLDEMAVRLQTKTDEHQREIARLVDEYTQQIDSLSRRLEDEKMLTTEVDRYRMRVEDLETEVQSLECTRGWFERRLNEAEVNLQSTRDHHEATHQREVKQHETEIRETSVKYEASIKDLETQLEIANVQKAEFEETIAKSKQEIRDALEDRKIHDKKGASIIKDLKRQLQIERKRVESLQERFQELLNESNQSRGDLYKTVELDKTETSSISSWSMMSGGGASENKEGKDDGSQPNGNSPTLSTNVMEENDALVAKCVALQEGKCDLEERLSYLEEANAAMAEDIVQKTAIIQFYCMDKRSDPKYRAAVDKLTVKRVLDFIKDRGDENQRKVNRRLQRILEEYLTKNMYLQKDLDAMSRENVVLRDTLENQTSADRLA